MGWPRARMRAIAPARTIYSIKRFMGLRGDEFPRRRREVDYSLVRPKGKPVAVEVAGKRYRPEEVSALILAKLKADAESALGCEVTRAVITVPAYFNDAQRNATKRAGELAGLTVERIVNEPTAAALAYGLDKLKEKARNGRLRFWWRYIRRLDSGAEQGVFQVLATNGNTRLGGDDIDRALLDWIAETGDRKAERKSLPVEAFAQLREAAVASEAPSFGRGRGGRRDSIFRWPTELLHEVDARGTGARGPADRRANAGALPARRWPMRSRRRAPWTK